MYKQSRVNIIIDGVMYGFLGVGAVLLIGLLGAKVATDKTTMMIVDCQRELPRDQRCELIAVPVEGE